MTTNTVPGPLFGCPVATTVEMILLGEHRAIVRQLEAQIDALVEQVEAYRRRDEMRRASGLARRAEGREAL